MAEESRRSVARGDLVTGLILLGAAAVGAWNLLGNQTLREFDYGADPGPGLVPSLLLVLLAVCAAALALRGLMGMWRRVPGPEPEDHPAPDGFSIRHCWWPRCVSTLWECPRSDSFPRPSYSPAFGRS